MFICKAAHGLRDTRWAPSSKHVCGLLVGYTRHAGQVCWQRFVFPCCPMRPPSSTHACHMPEATTPLTHPHTHAACLYPRRPCLPDARPCPHPTHTAGPGRYHMFKSTRRGMITDKCMAVVPSHRSIVMTSGDQGDDYRCCYHQSSVQ